MKKFLIHISCFFLILIIIFSFLNLYQSFNRIEPSHYFRKYLELTSENGEYPDITGIILGNSHAAYSLRPSVLDSTKVNYYNFAYGRATVDFYHDWNNIFLESYLKNHPEVNHCIISVDNYFLSNTEGRKVIQDSEYIPISVLWDLSQNRAEDRTSLVMNYFPAFKYRKKLLHTLKPRDQSSPFKVDEYDRGFIPYERPFKKENFERRKTSQVMISEAKKEAFRLLIDEFIKEKIQIYLVMQPEYNSSPLQYVNLRQFIDSVSIEYKIPFFDFNNNSNSNFFQNIEYYSDRGHLNSKGSLLYSKYLANSIMEYESETSTR